MLLRENQKLQADVQRLAQGCEAQQRSQTSNLEALVKQQSAKIDNVLSVLAGGCTSNEPVEDRPSGSHAGGS